MRTQARYIIRTVFSSLLFLSLLFSQQVFAQSYSSTYAVLVKEIITSPKKEAYKNLQDIGDVYYTIQSPGYKIYVGAFPSFDSALPSLRTLQAMGYENAKIESIPGRVRTNLLWGKERNVTSYSNNSPRGLLEFSNSGDFLTEVRVYQYNGNGWVNADQPLKISSAKRGLYNETRRSLRFDKLGTHRIYFAFQYKNHKINPLDIAIKLNFGSQTRQLEFNAKDNSYQFNATLLSTLPAQLAYTVTSERYGVQMDVSIPIRWESLSSPEPTVDRAVPVSPVQEYGIYTPRTQTRATYEEEDSYVLPMSYDAPVLTAKGAAVKGYFIQVAALGKRPDPEKFSSLERYGDVTFSYDNEVYRVKVGTFSSRTSAESTLRRIKRTYNGAFIIEEWGTEEFTDKAIPREYNTTPESYSTASLRQQYFVKLAAYSDPSWFDSEAIDDMGTCWEVKKGRLTVKYITLDGRKTPYEAKAALRDIRAAGFYEAVLMRKNSKGRLEAVE